MEGSKFRRNRSIGAWSQLGLTDAAVRLAAIGPVPAADRAASTLAAVIFDIG